MGGLWAVKVKALVLDRPWASEDITKAKSGRSWRRGGSICLEEETDKLWYKLAMNDSNAKIIGSFYITYFYINPSF